MNILNVVNFKDVLQKATLNFSIDSVQLKFKDEKVESGMISASSDAIVILNMNNDILPEVTDEVTFNFAEPQQQLVPFLNLIDDEEVQCEIKEEKLVLVADNQKADIHFCSPQIVKVFSASDPKEGTEYFLTMDVDDDFIEAFLKIKKIGARFGKVYFNVEDNNFIMETTDKSNRFSNGLRFTLVEKMAKKKKDEIDDLVLCFDYKNIVNLMSVLDEGQEYQVSFAYLPEQELGMLFLGSKDASEKYFIMSRRN